MEASNQHIDSIQAAINSTSPPFDLDNTLFQNPGPRHEKDELKNLDVLRKPYATILQYLDEGIFAKHDLKRVCVVGCRWGNLIYALKTGILNKSEFCGIDNNLKYIEIGNTIFENAGLSKDVALFCTKAQELSNEIEAESVDLTISDHFLHSRYGAIEKQEGKIFEEMYTVTCHGGYMLLTECTGPAIDFGDKYEAGRIIFLHGYTKRNPIFSDLKAISFILPDPPSIHHPYTNLYLYQKP